MFDSCLLTIQYVEKFISIIHLFLSIYNLNRYTHFPKMQFSFIEFVKLHAMQALLQGTSIQTIGTCHIEGDKPIQY